MFAITQSVSRRRVWRCVIPAIVMPLLASCGDNSPSRPVPAMLPVPVASVAVTPPQEFLVVGGTLQMTAVALDANGTPLPGRAISWSTSDASIVAVSTSGLLTPMNTGTVTITATSEGKSGHADITSLRVAVITVEVTPQTATMNVGSTQQLTARTLSSTGYPLPDRVVTWSSSDVSKATVNESGLVTAVAPGSATITATSEGKTASAMITVTPAASPAAARR